MFVSLCKLGYIEVINTYSINNSHEITLSTLFDWHNFPIIAIISSQLYTYRYITSFNRRRGEFFSFIYVNFNNFSNITTVHLLTCH